MYNNHGWCKSACILLITPQQACHGAEPRRKNEKKIDIGENSSFLLPLKRLRNISETSEFDTTEHYEDDPSGGDSFTDTPSSIDNGN